MDEIMDLKVKTERDSDLEEVLRIAQVSAYRCPSTQTIAAQDEELPLSWIADGK